MQVSEGHIVVEHLHREYVQSKSHFETQKPLDGLNDTAISKRSGLEIIGYFPI